MTPTKGRIVHVHLPTLYHGNNGGQSVAVAVVVRVHSPICVNLKVLLDGNSDLWLTSVFEGTEENHWFWPPRE